MYSMPAIRSFLPIHNAVLGAATDAAIGELHEATKRHSRLVHNQRHFDTHLPIVGELVLNYCVFFVLLVGQQVADECGLP